jgi:hypothetical protein
MSLAELKSSAVQLPEEQRRDLAAFLLQVGRERNVAWRDEMTRRMRDMDAGKKVSQTEFEHRIGLTAE